MSSSYLFLFSLGPVKSFIGQARKTRDLYAASRLLSDLILQAIQTFVGLGGRVVFPADDTFTHSNLPNRFLGEIQGVNVTPEKLRSIGEQAESAVKIFFREETQKIIDDLFKESSPNPTSWQPQIDNHLNIHWLFVPLPENIENAYEIAYKQISLSFGDIKNERRFSQLAEVGRKCQLEGERNALFYRPLIDKSRLPALLHHNPHIFALTKRNHDMYPGEALSAIGLLKRFYRKDNFPSTAEVATMSTVDTLKKSNDSAWIDYKQAISDWDYQLLFSDNLHEAYLQGQGYEELVPELPILQKKYKALTQALNTRHLRLGKYYALIVFDGDGAGEWLSGAYLPSNQDLQSFHQSIGRQLSLYATESRKYLHPPLGQAVFAGGDEFLGFINLDYLFVVLAKLRDRFDELVSKPVQQNFGILTPFTFSAGVVIAHYKEPLGDVVKMARALEHLSKDYPGKNALSLGIARHSDHLNSSSLTLPWTISGDNDTYINCLHRIVGLLQYRNVEGRRYPPYFSNTFIEKLHESFRKLGDEPNKGVLEPLLGYYLERSYMGPENQKAKRVKEMMCSLKLLWKKMSPTELGSALDCLEFISNHLNPTTIDV